MFSSVHVPVACPTTVAVNVESSITYLRMPSFHSNEEQDVYAVYVTSSDEVSVNVLWLSVTPSFHCTKV